MNLLIDIDVALDICTQRQPFAEDSARALAAASSNGARLWVYVGSAQVLEYTLRESLNQSYPGDSPQPPDSKGLRTQARRRLAEFIQGKHWLAALTADAPTFEIAEGEDAPLIRAVGRFPNGAMRLLTRNERLLSEYPDKTVSPAAYCAEHSAPPPLSFIDLQSQQDHIRPQLESRIHRVLQHGQYIMGPEVKEMEEKLAAYTGAKHCISCASGTEALLMALMALGVGPDDEVITTPFTFAATAEVIALVGATPVYVDIEPDTCLIDVAKLEAKISHRTKAIMPVSLYGQVADMDAINEMAARHGNIPVVEDAAQSFGATYRGRKSCNVSTIGCTSFFPSKPLGCYGDGGAVFLNDDALAKALREIRVHGQERRYYHTRVGLGGRMDTLQCAVVLGKLNRFDWEIERRIALGEAYRNKLTASSAAVGLLTVRPDRDCVWAQYTVFVENREAMQKALALHGIPTAVHYPLSLNRQPAYRNDRSAAETIHSHWAAERVMSLPMSPDLTEAQMDRVVAAVVNTH